MFIDTAAPFGLSSAAMMCQRTTSCLVAIQRSRGYDCQNYLDDFGGVCTSKEEAEMAYESMVEIIFQAGFELASGPFLPLFKSRRACCSAHQRCRQDIISALPEVIY